MPSAQDIAQMLRTAILNGAILPGQELRQEELAKRFEVSRMPVRDALNLLARDRLITLRPNRGGKVVALDGREIEEVYDLRILLETDALERAFEHIDESALGDIKLEMKRCEVEADTPDFPRADWRFHQALYAPASRPRQTTIIRELRDVCQMHEAAYAGLRTTEDRWSEDHRAIVNAIEAGNPKLARSLLKAHLHEAGRQLHATLTADRDT